MKDYKPEYQPVAVVSFTLENDTITVMRRAAGGQTETLSTATPVLTDDGCAFKVGDEHLSSGR